MVQERKTDHKNDGQMTYKVYQWMYNQWTVRIMLHMDDRKWIMIIMISRMLLDGTK